MISLTSNRPRLALLFVFVLAGFFLSTSAPVFTPTAHAQEAGDEGEKPKTEAPKDGQKRGLFMHIVKSVGWFFGIILLAISIGLLTLVVLLFMELRMGAAIPAGFVEDFTDTVNKRKFKEAYELAKDDGSYLARVMTTGMGRLQYGIDDAREAAFNMVESLKASKDGLINYLATIGTLGPLLGLVGTVWGMILSFMTLSQSSGGVNAQKLADDISHALVITLLGIGLSVPAIFWHTFFRNRLIRLSHDIENVADDLLTQMYHNSKKPGPGGAPTGSDAGEGRGVAAGGIKQK